MSLNTQWAFVSLYEAVDIFDTLRKPINREEREIRITNKQESELFPYYGATGQVGFIDDYLIEGEYVLLGEDGAPFLNPFAQKAYIITGKSWVNNHAHILRSKSGNNKFLCYYLNLFDYKGYVSGTTRLKLTQDQMKRIPVPVPPLPEQQRIVARIEELFSQLDAGVETLKKTKQQLEVYRQAVLKEAFDSCETAEALGVLCEHITDGDHQPPPKSEAGIPFIMISNIENSTINWDNTAFVGEEYYDNIDLKRRPQKGDVLYTVTGSFGIPICVDFDKKFCFQRHIALLRPNDHIDQKYLFYALQEPNVYLQAKQKATGTAQKTVGLGVLRTIKVPFTTSYEKQKRIVADIESKLSCCENITNTISESLLSTSCIRESILKQAFEGGL